MPYRDEQIRARKYELGVIPSNVEAKFTALKPLMLDLQEARQAEIVLIEKCARGQLDTNGIIGTMRIAYLNFVRAVYRASGAQSGMALQKMVTAEKAKALAYGLDTDLLDSVATCVQGAVEY